jgi:hypothetical protein
VSDCSFCVYFVASTFKLERLAREICTEDDASLLHGCIISWEYRVNKLFINFNRKRRHLLHYVRYITHSVIKIHFEDFD